MIKEVEKLADEHEIIIQTGHSKYHSNKMKIFDFISSAELQKLYEQADYIVTHAGAGSMFQAIKAGKKTVVFPRLQKYNEHVDNHQTQLANKLKKLGYLLVFEDGDAIMDVFHQLKEFEPIPYDLQGSIPMMIEKEIKKLLS